MTWRFEDTGFRNGVFNMEYDETLAKSLLNNAIDPTVRVYGWEPPALSLGWSQDLKDIDVQKAHANGIDVVRRPTGGRAILHSDELTYSVVMPAKGRNVSAVYDHISKALVCGLRKLGADVRLENQQVHFPTEYLKPSSAACFTSSARFEILVQGRKLVGSAQRRYSNDHGEEVVLQHGSILLGPHHQRIVEFLRIQDSERKILQKELSERTTDLCTVIGKQVEYGDIAYAIMSGFEETWQISFDRVSEQISLSTS